jgi:hypothetical protein
LPRWASNIGKNSCHVIGLDHRGAIVLRQKWSRGQMEARLPNLPPCLIGMEACVSAHHLSRKLQSYGHDARLMPAKYVRPYAKGQKNDFRDGETIAEAVQRPTMKFVATNQACIPLDRDAGVWAGSAFPARDRQSLPSEATNGCSRGLLRTYRHANGPHAIVPIMHLSRRCGARTRRGSRCQSPAMLNGRCRMHGGMSPGAPKGNRNAFKHGLYSAEAMTSRRQIAALLRAMKSLAKDIG